MVAALAGAALINATVRPLYNPLTPSLFIVILAVWYIPVYTGIFLWMYNSLVGPWTWSRFRIRSSGKTPVLDTTAAKVPEKASGQPEGMDLWLVRWVRVDS